MATKGSQVGTVFTTPPGLEHSPLLKSLEAYKAYELRLQGQSYVEIGDRMGISPSQARNFVREGLTYIQEELVEKVEEMRTLELERIDAMLASHWDHRHIPRHADVILKLQERRAKLVGLDVPTTDVTDAATTLRDFLLKAADNMGFQPPAPEPDSSEESE